MSIFLTFGSQFSHAAFKNTIETCTPIDIRNDVGPIRNQGDIGWCYANAAADLLSYEYREQLQGQQASAIYTALTFTDTFIGKNFFEGGSAYFSLKAYAAKHKSICLQSEEEKLLENGFKGISLKKRLTQLALLKSTYDAQVENSKLWNDFFQQWMKLKKSKSHIFSMGDQKLHELLRTSNSENFPDKVADTLCANSAIPVKQKSDVGGRLTLTSDYLKASAVEDINNQLNRKNIVGLAYRASVLVDPKVAADLDSAHLSVLVGRKWNSQINQCEYLIRNSWGKGCGAYRNSPVFKQRCEGDGHVWIPESIMKKSMMGISYYDKKPSLVSKSASVLVKAIAIK